MTTILTILIISMVFVGITLLTRKGKPENNDPQGGEQETSEKPGPLGSLFSKEFSKKKEELNETLETTLKSRFPIVPLLKIPPTPENFIGRKPILGDVFSQIGKGPTLIGLYGNSGVGKTTLGQVMAKNLLSDFPDEPIYIDMQGSSVKPLTHAEVMTRIIHLLSPHEKYPETESKKTQLYRTLLERRKSVLFLDNVPAGQKLSDLIPPINCALIMTSIQSLNLPHLISKKLNPLDPKDAQDLLLKTSPRTGFLVNEIAKMCNNFPLTLYLFAKYIGDNPNQDPTILVKNFGVGLKRLKPEARIDVKQSLELVLTLSYQSLSEKASTVFRKLVLFPDTFDDKAETFLCEDPDSEHLVKLTTLGMVTTNSETNRFSLHDWVRRFLTNQLKESEKLIAEKRFATYFLTVVIYAGELYNKGGKDRENGLNLFDLEWGNIQKGQEWAHSNSDHEEEADNICLSYTEAAIHLLGLRQSTAQRIKWFEAALNSSKRLNESEAENKYLLLLGMEHNKLHQAKEALGFLEKALQGSQQSDDVATERKVLGQLGLTHRALGTPHRAIEYLEKELELLRKSGETEGEEAMLENLGDIYNQVGESNRAIEYFKEELKLAEEKNADQRLGRIFGDLGKVYFSLGNHENAIESFQKGLILVQKTKDKKGEIILLGKLGKAYTDINKFKKALGFYRQGLAIARKREDQKNEAVILDQMGHAYLKSRNHREATMYFQKTLTLFKKTGNITKEGETLWNLAQAAGQAEKTPEAIQLAEAALVLYRKIKRLDKDTRKSIEYQLQLWKEKPTEKKPAVKATVTPEDEPAP